MLAKCFKPTGSFNLRGRGGRIACLRLAWKAATRIEPGRAFLTNALLIARCERAVVDVLLTAGKLGVSLVEKDRLVAAEQTWRRAVDLTIEAIV